MKKQSWLLVECSIVACIAAIPLPADVWTETTQEDFRDGFFDRDIYASQRDGGTVEFSLRWDLNNDEYIDIPMARNLAGASYVYWGTASGYSTANIGVYPLTDAGECAIADVNHDGYPELFFVSVGNYIRMFHGTATGPDPYNYSTINIPVWNSSCFIADYNKDGDLDMAVSAYYNGYGVVFYGDGSGNFSIQDSFISTYGLGNIESADFNKDSWLDLVSLNGYGTNRCSIYFGSENGFDHNYRIDLPRPGTIPGPVNIADLNKDSNLDLILSSWGYDTSYIYTGHDDTFELWITLNTGHCWGGSAIANFDNNAWLDILFMKGQEVNEQPYIYWGSIIGYSDANRTAIGAPDDISGALVADYNADSILDIFIYNFEAYDDSYFLYGPDYLTPSNPLPGGRLGHNWRREIGNIYDREYYDSYLSSVFDAGMVVDWGTIEWDDSIPSGSSVKCCVRTGNTPQYDSTWSTWFLSFNGDSIPDTFNARYLQYMARFIYTNPAQLPCLYEVRVSYDSLTGIQETNEKTAYQDVTIAPNPFNSKATIIFSVLQNNTDVTVAIFDNSGRCVRELIAQTFMAGSHQVIWRGEDNAGHRLPAGLYYVTVRSGKDSSTSKLVILKD
ncbi:MAG: VCBS repeat-containing protein [candidate division WOR-3 bacterium]|nr:MAG: VCBS repeat-containing protein [candidate division WOR-3 bacterium]